MRYVLKYSRKIQEYKVTENLDLDNNKCKRQATSHICVILKEGTHDFFSKYNTDWLILNNHVLFINL